MPEGFPAPPGLTEAEIARSDGFLEGLYGPVVAAYTPTAVTTGDHPQEVKDAWVGVRLPVREKNEEFLQRGCVWVDAAEAYNALVASGASEHVLSYWIRTLPEDPTTMLGFDEGEGELERVESRTLRVPLPIGYEPCPPDGFDLDSHERTALRRSEAGEIPF